MHQHRANPTRPIALLSRLALTLNMSLGLGYVGLWVMLALQGQFWRADFSSYYAGWSIVRDGQGNRLYDLDLQAHYQRQILEEGGFQGGVLPYLNPPYVALPFVPLTWLPRPVAFLVWTGGQVALLAWLLRLLHTFARSWSRDERWLMLSSVVAFPPLFVTGLLGTFSLLILVCVVQWYLALKNHREVRAGLWFTLGTVKPQLLLMPGVMLLGARRWRTLGAALLAGSVLVVISGILVGWQSWPGFVHLIRMVNDIYGDIGIVPTVMYNLKGTLALMLGNERGALINQISTGVLALVSVAILVLWRGPWQPDPPRFDLYLALTLLAGLLFLPHLNPHDGLLLVAPAVLFYHYLRQHLRPRGWYAAFALSCPWLFLVGEFTVGGNLGIRIPVIAMGVLLGWMAKEVLRKTRNQLPAAAEREAEREAEEAP
ncbi:MAG: DUF2029 domain-containing protein [Chloroflexaceae bacterium]|nr:DUF2029 domain-containing protein [Chloroflexaceae bacterium]